MTQSLPAKTAVAKYSRYRKAAGADMESQAMPSAEDQISTACVLKSWTICHNRPRNSKKRVSWLRLALGVAAGTLSHWSRVREARRICFPSEVVESVATQTLPRPVP